MYSIWKYHIPLEDYFNIELPKNSMILEVNTQDNKPTMWVLVETNVDLEKRYFRMFGTGQKFETISGLSHIGTIQMFKGDFVWHVFEEFK